MRITKLFMVPALTLGLAVGVAACDVDQTEEGDLPEVNVEGGNLPEYDVDAAEIEVNTDTSMVVTPDVDIVTDDTIG